MCRVIIIVLLMGLSVKGLSQDPQFSQYYAIPLYLCPSFAGGTDGTRVAMNYRNQWSSLPNAFVSYAFSFDHYLFKQYSGVGLLAMRDESGAGGLTTSQIGLLYSYNVVIKKKWSIRPGLSLNFTNRGVDFNKLYFKDQLLTGNSTSLYESPPDSKTYFDASVSLAFYTAKVWNGITVDHLVRPNQSLTGGMSRVPIKLSIYGGAVLKKGKFTRYHEKNVTVTYLYKHQEKFDQLDIGFYLKFYPFMTGMWYRGIPFKPYELGYPNNDAIVLLFGLKTEYVHFAYSYDITISGLYNVSGGSHEISLIFEFNQNQKANKKYKYMIVPCPKF